MDAIGQEPDDDGGAERAFEALRAEVASLRRGIELLYRQGDEARTVDYTLTLGQIMKTLEAVQGRLTAIESKPALEMTPAIYRAEIDNAGRLAGEVAGRMLREGAARSSPPPPSMPMPRASRKRISPAECGRYPRSCCTLAS